MNHFLTTLTMFQPSLTLSEHSTDFPQPLCTLQTVLRIFRARFQRYRVTHSDIGAGVNAGGPAIIPGTR